MKDGIYDNTKGVSKILNNNSEIFSVDEFEAMNKTIKNYSMNFFVSFRKINMNAFMSWKVWIYDTLNKFVVKKNYVIQWQDSRLDKIAFFADLYSDFEELKTKICLLQKSDKD